jgi:hypothetical protein
VRRRSLAPQIVDDKIVAALARVERHAAAHRSQADETDAHISLLFVWIVLARILTEAYHAARYHPAERSAHVRVVEAANEDALEAASTSLKQWLETTAFHKRGRVYEK